MNSYGTDYKGMQKILSESWEKLSDGVEKYRIRFRQEDAGAASAHRAAGPGSHNVGCSAARSPLKSAPTSVLGDTSTLLPPPTSDTSVAGSAGAVKKMRPDTGAARGAGTELLSNAPRGITPPLPQAKPPCVNDGLRPVPLTPPRPRTGYVSGGSMLAGGWAGGMGWVGGVGVSAGRRPGGLARRRGRELGGRGAARQAKQTGAGRA